MSLLLGAWTHIIWDSFTHAGSWLAEHFTLLRQPLFTLGGQSFPVAYCLQQLSTVAGSLLLTIAYARWLRSHRIPHLERSGNDRWRYAFWIFILILPIFVALPAAAQRAHHFSGYLAFRVFVFRTVIYYLAIFAPLVTIAAGAVLVGRWKTSDDLK